MWRELHYRPFVLDVFRRREREVVETVCRYFSFDFVEEMCPSIDVRMHEGLLKKIPRLRFLCVIITTLYQLMLHSWYRKTAQSLVNTLVLFRHSEIFSYYGILISRMKCNFWQSLNSVHGVQSYLKFSKI